MAKQSLKGGSAETINYKANKLYPDSLKRLTRRANALVLLDDGWSCQKVAAAFLLNDDTIRGWHKLFEQRGI
jgi:transposase